MKCLQCTLTVCGSIAAHAAGVALCIINAGCVQRVGFVSKSPIFPSTVNGWQAAGGVRAFDRDTVFDYMNGAGELYLAYDFQRVLVQDYTKRGASRIIAETYEMSTSEDAYGVFTHDPEGEEAGIGQRSSYAAGLLRFWKGRFCFRILAERDTAEAKTAVVGLARALARPIASGPCPDIVTRLPENGLDPDSVRYFHTQVSLNSFYYLSDTNMLGLSAATEVAMGTYRRHGRGMELLIIRYEETDGAIGAYREFGCVYLKDKAPIAGPLRLKTIEQDRVVGMLTIDRFLILVLDATSRNACERILAEAAEQCRKGDRHDANADTS